MKEGVKLGTLLLVSTYDLSLETSWLALLEVKGWESAVSETCLHFSI